MTPEEQKAADDAAAAAAKQAEEDAKKATEEAAKNPPQDPLKEEAERIRKEKEGKTELEKAIFTRNKINSRIRELGGDAEEPTADEDPDDNVPVTVGMLKKRDQERAAKTALSLADEQVQDETERDLVKHHLENSIKSSGNPSEDLRKARALVNETKNRQIAEDAARKRDPQRTSRASGAPGKIEPTFEPTAEELPFMRPPWNMTKDQIIAARPKE